MPNWSKIAETIARGQYGERWRKEDEDKQNLARVKQAMELAQSAEGRAAAEEGRRGDEFNWEKTQRGSKEKRSQAEAARAQSEAIVSGNVANNWSNELARKIAKEEADMANDKERLKLEAQRLGISTEELKLRRQESAQRQALGDLELQTAQATQAARIADVNNKQANMTRRQRAQLLNANINQLIRQGDDDSMARAQELQDELAYLQGEDEKDATVAGIQQEILNKRNARRTR